jgi:hypothetical protein
LIFTRAATSAGERRQALDHDLVLIGHSEILDLLEMTKKRADARLAFEYFRGVMSKAGLENMGLGSEPFLLPFRSGLMSEICYIFRTSACFCPKNDESFGQK